MKTNTAHFIAHLFGAVLFSIAIATIMAAIVGGVFEIFAPHDAGRVRFVLISGGVGAIATALLFALNKRFNFI